jgi:hypothetical protein
MLKFADIDNTKMSKAGCRWLSKADWKILNSVNLSIIVITKVKITYFGRVANN